VINLASEVFIQLAVILFTAFIISYIARSLKQPIIIGYIIAGMIIAAFIGFGFDIEASQETITIFSDLGIAFLLFIVGLHLNPKIIKEIGGAALVVGLVQIILTFGLGFVVSLYILGYGIVGSAYVGIALAFSSTIIIMKLLSDKKNLDSLYGKISIGILIVQDLVAVAVLMFISSLSNGTTFSSFALRTLLGGGVLIIVLSLFAFFVIPKLMRGIARSQELLFLFSISWAFVVAALFSYFGFSIEVGALLAGVALSISPYAPEISSKIRPLRDFFLIIFFIILGLNVKVNNLEGVIFSAIILSIIALVFKPFIIMSMMAFSGYTKRNNFLTGTTLAQISEFSLIVLTLGFSLGHISQEILTTITLTGIITITLSTYMIIYSDQFYSKMKRIVSIFEKKSVKKDRKKSRKYDAILFGYNRIGFGILGSLKRIKKSYMVVDYNPDTIANLTKARIPALYGDAFDSEFLDDLPLDKIQLAVSTIPDYETSMLLIEHIRIANPKAIIIVRAKRIRDAIDFYKKGASYVLTPHFLGGEYVSKMIRADKVDREGYNHEKEKHIRMLKKISKRGFNYHEGDRD